MTLGGTNTWLLSHGTGSYAVIDPGPLMHEQKIMSLTYGRISAIFLTHRHGDHSACAAALAAQSQAPVFAADPQFASDTKTILSDEQIFNLDDLTLRVVAVPGHTSDSVAFLATSLQQIALFTGDTILGEGSSIITFPDGDLGAYLRSLDRLESVVRAQDQKVPLLPGHGSTHADSLPLISKYRIHRLARLDEIRNAIAQGASDALSVVNLVYKDIPEALHSAAVMTVEAQLAYLNGNA